MLFWEYFDPSGALSPIFGLLSEFEREKKTILLASNLFFRVLVKVHFILVALKLVFFVLPKKKKKEATPVNRGGGLGSILLNYFFVALSWKSNLKKKCYQK